MRWRGQRGFLTVALVACAAALVLLYPSDALAQCALCKTAVEKSGMAKALNLGIVILLVPPVSIFCSLFVVAYKRRKGGDGQANDGEEDRGAR